jgi:hypothetical protein
MNPLRHQMQQLAQAPGIASNPFEKILAGFGIVRDDVRHMAMSDYQYARRNEMYDARRKQERSEIDASALNRADLQARNMKLAHDLEMERMDARHGLYKERHANDGNAETQNPAQDAGDNPALKKEKPAPDPLKQKRSANGVRPDGDAYIKDIEMGVRDWKKTGGKIGIDPLESRGLSKAYDAREDKRAAHKAAVDSAAAAAGKGKPAGTASRRKSNVGPDLNVEAVISGPDFKSGNELDEKTGPVNPAGNGQQNSGLSPERYKQATGDLISDQPDYSQGAGRKDRIN